MKNKIINLFNKPNVTQNEGLKYSQLLEKFLEPFVREFEDAEYVDDLFDLAIYAWNTANLKSFVPKEDFENTLNSNNIENPDSDLMLKMIAHKEKYFKDYTNFIVDYELKETSGDPILTVVTQEQDSYLATMLDIIGNENTADDFEENHINRKAIILKPAQPYIDWYAAFNPDDLAEMKETRTYLINEDIDDVNEWLQKMFDKLFMFELELFQEDKKKWPQKRNYKMFKEWFHIDISSMIYDFEHKPVSKTL